MPAPSNLKEFIAIVYGPGREADRRKIFADDYKASRFFAKADMFLGDANVYRIVYGASAYSWLNYASELWSIFPKRPQGQNHGFRILIESATAASGLQETANFKATTKATFVTLDWNMKWMNDAFGMSEQAQYYSEHDDALDRWDIEREHWGKNHVKSIDNFLARPAYVKAEAFGAGTGGATAVTQATFVIETIDRMINSSSEATFYVGNGGISGGTSANLYPYDANKFRLGYAGTGYGNGAWDSVVDENAGVLRAFDLDLLDGVLRQVEINGATRAGLVMLTGPDTADVIAKKLEAKQRFTTVTRMSRSLNGVTRETGVGVDAGFEAMTYKSIPIFTARALWAVRGAIPGALTPIYGVHLPDAYISVGMPTLYLQTDRDDWLVLDKLRYKAAYVTAAELVFTRFNTHFKIRDIQE